MNNFLIKQNVTNFLKFFGVIWLIVEPIALFKPRISELGLGGYLIIILISLIFTIIDIFTRKEIKVYLKDKNLEVVVTNSDIIKANGNIVIGVSDTFDTELGDIINPQSLIGKFQTEVYGSNKSQMDHDIEVSLGKYSYNNDTEKCFGKIRRYSLGTTAVLSKNNNKYFLPALNTMKPIEYRVFTKIDTLWNSLYKCWSEVRNKGNHSDVHIPVFGTKFGRTNMSYNQMIYFIITSFLFATDEEAISNRLYIHIYKDDSSKVDYISLKNWLESLKNV